MKLVKLFLIAIITTLTVSNISAQTETTIGGLVAYGTEIESVGIGANAEFPILEKLTLSPSFIYFLPKEAGLSKINWFELNANANYYFLDQETVSVYGIGGLNYSSVKVTFDGENDLFGNDFSASDGRVGLNLGAGANFSIGGRLIPFTEIKYVLIDGGQLVIAGGVKFKI